MAYQMLGLAMRGAEEQAGSLFSYVDLEARVPRGHPLRAIRAIVDEALAALSADFDAIYAPIGRPSIPPEQLLRALLLQAFYTVRSERQLMEQLDYNLLFRWFVGLGVDDAVWDSTVFTKNRDRLLDGEVAAKFFATVLDHARVCGLLSDEHFSVDGTLIRAWASMKSFRPKDGAGKPPALGRNGERDFRGERRSNETHRSTTDEDARLFRKADGQASQLCFMGHVLMENRNGLAIDVALTRAAATAERITALPEEVEHWSLTTLRDKLVKNWCSSCPPRPLRRIPAGRSGGAASVVPRDPPSDRVAQAKAISDMTARPSVSASPQERCARDRSLGASMPRSALPRGGKQREARRITSSEPQGLVERTDREHDSCWWNRHLGNAG